MSEKTSNFMKCLGKTKQNTLRFDKIYNDVQSIAEILATIWGLAFRGSTQFFSAKPISNAIKIEITEETSYNIKHSK